MHCVVFGMSQSRASFARILIDPLFHSSLKVLGLRKYLNVCGAMISCIFSFALRGEVIESIYIFYHSIKIEPRDKWAGFAF